MGDASAGARTRERVVSDEQAGFELTADATWVVARLEMEHIEQLAPALAARVLAEARERLSVALRTGDRLDEASRGFWLALGTAGPDLEERLAGRVLDTIGLQPFDLGGGQFLRRTASIGWAPSRGSRTSPRACRCARSRRWPCERCGWPSARGATRRSLLPVDAERTPAVVRAVRTAGPDLVDETPTAPLPLG